MESAIGNLVIVDINTKTPKIYWKGIPVLNIIKTIIRNDDDDYDVKFIVTQTNTQLDEMKQAGINIKIRGALHE